MLGAKYTTTKVVTNDKIQVMPIIGAALLNGIALSAIYIPPTFLRQIPHFGAPNFYNLLLKKKEWNDVLKLKYCLKFNFYVNLQISEFRLPLYSVFRRVLFDDGR